MMSRLTEAPRTCRRWLLLAGAALLLLSRVLPARADWVCSGGVCSTTTGSVGVGTSAPSSPLTIVSSGLTNPIEALFSQNTDTNVSTALQNGQGAWAFSVMNSANTGNLWVTPNTAFTNPALVLTRDGKVGIGTTTPGTPLAVVSNGLTNPVEAVFAQPSNTNVSTVLQNNQGSWAFSIMNSANTGNLWITPNTSFTSPALVVTQAGKVGIGTTAPAYDLAVRGTIGAKEVRVTNQGWADYVLAPEYRLAPLGEIAGFIREHRHLPGIPSEAEVEANGIGVGQMQAKLLAKVEELTLYLIRAEERSGRLERRNDELQRQIRVLEETVRRR